MVKPINKFLDVLKAAGIGAAGGFLAGGPFGAAGGALVAGARQYANADHTESDRRDLMKNAVYVAGLQKKGNLTKKEAKKLTGLVKKFPPLGDLELLPKLAAGDVNALAQAIPQQKAGEGMFGGTEDNVKTFNKYSPEQQQAMSQLLGDSLAGMKQFNPDFSQIENKARQDFAQKTVPGIAERFSSLGSGGSQRSSAFGQQLGAAGAGLETNLAALGQDFGNQNRNYFKDLAGIGLRPQFDTLYAPGREGFGSKFGGKLMDSLLTGDNVAAAMKYLGAGF